MPYFLSLLGVKKSPQEQYSSVRSSEDDSSKDGLLEKRIENYGERPSLWRRYRTTALVHTALLAFYTLTVAFLVTRLRQSTLHGPDLIRSPAYDAIRWEERTFFMGDKIQENSEFSGRPSPSVDKAWHDLLNAENIRIEPEIMKRLGREDIGVRVPGGDDYIGTLNVYHELHCLKRLHQYMYQDTYFPNINAHQKEMNRLHNEHCIDFLRQSVMCHGDVGLITFEWKANDRIPVANATTHQCVNWESLDKWTKDRTVDMLKPGWLVHPTLGLAYPQNEGDIIGASPASGFKGHGGHNH